MDVRSEINTLLTAYDVDLHQPFLSAIEAGSIHHDQKMGQSQQPGNAKFRATNFTQNNKERMYSASGSRINNKISICELIEYLYNLTFSYYYFTNYYNYKLFKFISKF
jgi:hypothetical protein